MNKKFTLIELVSVIVILSILLSIVLLKVSDLRKKSIYSMVSSNTTILQSAVDQYYLKEEKYPIKNNLTLSSPQIVNVEELVNKGYVKKDLDLSKITSQLYWVDVFGRVWGATENPPNNVTVLKGDDKNSVSFLANNENIVAYNIYEVSGDNLEIISYKDFNVQKPNKKRALASGKTKYQLVYSDELDKDSAKAITYEGKNKDSIYLVSVVDDYGLESAPVGLGDNDYFSPLINFIGTREYEIEGSKTMYWIDFITVENKPAGTNISYLFKVKDENGEYGEWTEDYFSLEPSKGIIVKVSMTSENNQVKPSLYDLHILYNFGDTPGATIPNPEIIPPAGVDPISPLGGTTSSSGGGLGTGGSSGNGGSNGGDGSSDDSGSGGSGSGNNDSDGSVGSGSNGTNPSSTCPAGFTQSTFKSNGTTTTGSNQGLISFLFDLPEGSMIEQLIDPKIIGGLINGVNIQYVEKGSSSAYIVANSLFEIPPNSCINLVYSVTSSGGGVSLINKPIVKTGEKTSHKKISGDNDGFIPVEDEEDKEWTTVDEVRFTGNSQTNQPVKWTGFEKDDTVPENTRIQYLFIGSNGSSWSEPTQNLSEMPEVKTAVVIAKLQVKTSELKNPTQEQPYITKMKLIHEGGEVHYNSNKVLNNSDSIFYLADGILNNEERAFDGDQNSLSVTSLVNAATSPIIKWKFKEGVKAPNSLEGKSVKLIAKTSTNIDNVMYVIDKNGKHLSFYYRAKGGSRFFETSSLRIDNTTLEYYIALPKEADSIKFSANGNSGSLQLYEIGFSELSSSPFPFQKVNIQTGFTNASLTWEKPSDVASVDVYRDNVYIGTTTGATFNDPSTLVSNQSYNYSFILSDKHHNIIKQSSDEFQAKTLERDIIFNATGKVPSNVNDMFDDNIGSVGAITLTFEDSIFFEWKLKEGYNPDLTGKALKVRAATVTTNTRKNLNSLRVFDENGQPLAFYYRKGTDGSYLYNTGFSITTELTDYYIVLPEGAKRIAIYPVGETAGALYIYDMRFNNPNKMPSELENIKIQTGHTNASIRWDKPSNVESVEVYRDNVYIGTSKGTSFTDPHALTSNTTYTYSFIVSDSSYNSFKQTSESFTVKTLEKDITFIATGKVPSNGNYMFDDNINSVGAVTLTSADNLFLEWRLRNGYNADLTGKSLKIRAATVTTNTRKGFNTLRVFDENGRTLNFYYRRGTDTKYTFNSAISFDTTVSDYFLALPEGASKIGIYPATPTAGALYIYDVKFNNPDTTPDAIENLAATVVSNKAILTWKQQSNVVSSEIFKNGVYVGVTNNNRFDIPTTHTAGTSHTYTVVSRNANHNIVTKDINIDF